jgi:hypothetical protein
MHEAGDRSFPKSGLHDPLRFQFFILIQSTAQAGSAEPVFTVCLGNVSQQGPLSDLTRWRLAMKDTIFVAAALLVGTTAFAIAQSNTGGGASSMSPGHEMQSPSGSSSTGKGASEYSPGDRMQDSKGTVGKSRGSTKGASEYSPGDRMHDKSTKDKY